MQTNIFYRLKQAELKSGAIADMLHESNKPLTRYNDDEDLEAMRKAEVREDDPMAAHFLKKKRKEQKAVNGRCCFTLFLLLNVGQFCNW